MLKFWNIITEYFSTENDYLIAFGLTCSVIVDKGLSVEYKSPSIEILDFGKSWTVTATANVPFDVKFAMKLIVHVF